MSATNPSRPWLHDREHEDAALAALREKKRFRPTSGAKALSAAPASPADSQLGPGTNPKPTSPNQSA